MAEPNQQLFIPEKIKVGYQKRAGTYTENTVSKNNKLGDII